MFKRCRQAEVGPIVGRLAKASNNDQARLMGAAAKEALTAIEDEQVPEGKVGDGVAGVSAGSSPVVARLIDSPSLSDPSFSTPEAREYQAGEKQTRRRRWYHRPGALVGWFLHRLFCIASLIVLLAVLTAIPVVQLIAFGYLLRIAGNLVSGQELRNALPGLHQAGQIGMAGVFLLLVSIPTQLLTHQESVAAIINPGSLQATLLRIMAVSASIFALTYLLWAWVRGGRLSHYLWPEPKRIWRDGFRWSTWSTAPDRLWDFTLSLEIPKLFWLGVRGAVGTLVWLIPAIVLVITYRTGETGMAGVVGFLSLLMLGVALLYVPMLQAHFAAENRLAALFEVGKIRSNFRNAPWAWLAAMTVSLVILPIPLYLLKIEATPREVMWLPCLVFVAFILPARVASGLALRRARQRGESSGKWGFFSRGFVRLAMIGVVAIYLGFVQVSQYTSWDGYLTWIQQHAILIPVPFLNGT